MALDLKTIKTLFAFLLLTTHLSGFAQGQSLSKDRLIGSILKNALETYHYTKKKI